MAKFGDHLKKRLEELHKAGQDVPKIMAEVAEGATIEAVRVATEETPPNGGAAIAGTNMRSGQLAQHWAADSTTTPTRSGNKVQTTLANNMQYASYVNDGHRVDKHFVPGLIANGSLLERDPKGKGGLMVGVKTTYVKGRYMKQKAVSRYKRVVSIELDKRVREAFK